MKRRAQIKRKVKERRCNEDIRGARSVLEGRAIGGIDNGKGRKATASLRKR